MNGEFRRYLRAVTLAHLGILAVLLLATGFRSVLQGKAEPVPALEFLVNVATEEPEEEPPPSPEPPSPPPPEPKVKDIPDVPPEPKPKAAEAKETPKPAEPPKPPKKTIEVSRKKVTRPAGSTRAKPEKRLSPAEIERLLAMGARPSNRTVIPESDELRCFAVIHDRFYEAWAQPSREEAGSRPAVATIRLLADGTVADRRLTSPSGNAIMDDSVREALNGVRAVRELSPEFLRKYREVKITFELK
jgi:outer membrane biosynthesis protein TonB